MNPLIADQVAGVGQGLLDASKANKEYVDKAITAGGLSALASVLMGLAMRQGKKKPDQGKKLSESLQLGDLYSDSADPAEAMRRIYKAGGEKTAMDKADLLVGGTGLAMASAAPAVMFANVMKQRKSESALDVSKKKLHDALARYHHLLKKETLSGSGVEVDELKDKAHAIVKEGAEKLSVPMATLLSGLGIAGGAGGFNIAYDQGAKRTEGAVAMKKMREAIEKQQRLQGAPATADVGMTPEEMIAYEALRREHSGKGRKARVAQPAAEDQRSSVSASPDDPALKDLLASV
jgi:hypothetical protein